MNEPSSFWEGGSKTLFYTGLFLGVASTLVVVMGFVFSNGMSFSGRAIAADTTAPTPSVVPNAPTPAPAGPLKPVDEKVDHIIGAKNAKVTLVEYSDFECPYCDRHAPTMKQVLEAYPNDVRIVYRHYPLSFHPNAQKAAEASECAAKLGGNDKFWQMHDKLFDAREGGLSIEVYKKAAGELGLKQADFDKCLDSGEMAARVQADEASGNDAGVSGTPATYVNGSLVEGAQPFAAFKAAIDQALNR